MNRLDNIISREKVTRLRDLGFASFIVLSAIAAILAVAHH